MNVSMPGAIEWMVIFTFLTAAVPIVLVAFVLYHLYQQTKLLRQIKDEIRRNNGGSL
jgi:heme exporter protein D